MAVESVKKLKCKTKGEEKKLTWNNQHEICWKAFFASYLEIIVEFKC